MTSSNTLKGPETGPLLATEASRNPDFHSASIFKTIFTGPNGMRSGWRLLIFEVLMWTLLAGFILIRNGGIEGIKRAYAHRGEMTVTPLLMGGSEGIAFVLICLATFIMSKIEHRKFAQYGLPLRQFLRKELWIGILGGFLALSFALLAIYLLHGFRVTGLALHGAAIVSAMAAWGAAFLVVGLCEEFMDRGYVQYTLASGIGFWPAAFVTSSLFAFGHAFNASESVVGVAAVLLFGLLHCFFLRRTGTLWCAVGFHAGWDWGQTCLYGVPDSGIVPYHSVFHSALNGPRWLTGGVVGPEASIFCPIALLVTALIFSRLYREDRYSKLKLSAVEAKSW
jgi:membrane protease YdiL (CAAX protease family)